MSSGAPSRTASPPPSPVPDAAAPSVLHVVWSGEVGGVERLVRDLAGAQQARGMRVGVALARDRGPLADELAARGIPVVDLRLDSGFALHPRSLERAARLMGDWDVTHLHGFNAPLALAAMRAGRTVVLTDHGSRPQGGRRLPRELAKRALRAVFLRLGVDSATANSRHTAERASKLYGLSEDRITVVLNGVEVDDLALRARPPQGGGLVVAFVGRLVDFKRVDRLLQAAARLPASLDVRFLVIGGGPREGELRALASRLRVEDRVSFLGESADVPSVLGDADVLVQPSEGEPFGLVLVEACVLGLLPIAFTDGGGALEVLPPDGRVVAGVEQLAATLRGLAGSPELSPEARQARSAWARRAFPIEATARGYDAVYRNVVGKAQER